MLVPNEALGALKLEAFLRVGGGNAGVIAVCLWAMGGRWGSMRTLLWAATHSTLPSAATHFSRPQCISLGSLHCSSTWSGLRRVRARHHVCTLVALGGPELRVRDARSM